ncbi:MAG: cupin domain-containing protein [Haloarculaceae archaeon]
MPEQTSLDEHEASPHAEIFPESPRTVRLHLESDEAVPEHRHPGTGIVLHLLDGALELTLGEETYDLAAGDLIQFDGDQPIAPHAREESDALLVFAPKRD